MRFLILTAMVGLSLGAGSDPPRPCCTDHQFEAVMGQVGGNVYNHHGHLTQNWLDGYNKVHYDAYNKMIAVEAHQTLMNGSVTVTNILLDYPNKRQYIQNQGNCYHTPLTRTMREPCVPDSAQYIGPTYMGYGTSKLALNNWEYHPKNTDQSLKVALTQEGCTPIVESFVGHVKTNDGKETIETNFVYVFSEFRTGLRNSDVFNVPQACRMSSSIPNPVGRSVRHVQTLFSQ
ncbi:ependymin-related protein 1-like [Haliotis cracherodii]|uniref:ependymin-related protein 1-like n=1 Tax=Haliotis cracherodii TaxID=6455 RepID=UPI0039E7808E